jgi:DNA-binding protein H-NS
MQRRNLKSMSVDELWRLYEQLVLELSSKLQAEEAMLNERLHKLTTSGRSRRSYQKLPPKYQNPQSPSETWAGRGKQPRWLTAQLRSGKKLEDFLIKRSPISDSRRSSRH